MQLQSRAASQEYQLFKEWLTLMLEDAKNNLVTCEAEVFQRQQGEAKAYQQLIRQMERKSLTEALNREN